MMVIITYDYNYDHDHDGVGQNYDDDVDDDDGYEAADDDGHLVAMNHEGKGERDDDSNHLFKHNC